MARGWESKSIESQQEEAAAAKPSRVRPLSPEDLQRRGRRATLEMARARALADLQRARTEAHRTLLRQTLAALEEQLSALE